jgi:ABC-2 type transport system permease protein
MTTAQTAVNGNGSVIHDIGYKPYTGPRLGRAEIVRALYFFSLRSAFGFGRGAKARIIPLLTFGAMMLPAAISIYKVATVGGDPALRFDHYAYNTVLLMIVFIAVAAPELVSRDLRHHTLPLYFSRPLRRADYPLAKLLALGTAIVLFEAVPLIAMYLGIIASSTSGSGVWGQTKALVPGLGVALAYGIVFAPLTLLIASATGRRAIVTGAIAIFFLATTAISGVMESVGTHYAAVQDQGSGTVGPGGGPGGPVDERIGTPTYDAIARNGALIDPLRMIEGTRVWISNADDGRVPPPGGLGGGYLAELVVLTGLTTGGLFLRYRRVGIA